jgi:hypothetical protein
VCRSDAGGPRQPPVTTVRASKKAKKAEAKAEAD